jgi:hypothetical protein
MSNQILNSNNKNKDGKNYNLIERTAKFGEDIIEFAGSLRDTSV